MKKKWILGVAAALVACMGLAACGGTQNAEQIKGEEVTAEEWIAAFGDDQFENYQLIAKYSTEVKEGDKTGKYAGEAILTVAGGKQHIVMTEKTEVPDEETEETTEETYVDTTGEETVYYMKNEQGEWEPSNGGMSADTVLDLVKEYAPLYELFTYDKEKKGYVVKADADLGEVGVGQLAEGLLLKFKNGKFVGMYAEFSETDENGDYEKVVYDYFFSYGGQSVTLPATAQAAE